MAFDTENQRRSALNSVIYRNLPIADGTIGIDDRAMMLFQYAHDSFPAPPAVILAVFSYQSTVQKNFTFNSAVDDSFTFISQVD